jgi:Flp pilus assembly protein TadD
MDRILCLLLMAGILLSPRAARASDDEDCRNTAEYARSERIAACSRLLATGTSEKKLAEEYLSLRASAFLDEGKLDEALTDYNALARSSPSPEALRMEGLVHHMAGRYEAAVEILSQSLALDATYAPALEQRGYSLARLKKFDAALADAQSLVEHHPNNAAGYQVSAWVKYKAGDLAGAAADIDLAADYAPQDDGILSNRGEINEALHRMRIAKSSFQAALLLRGDSDEGKAALERVSKQVDALRMDRRRVAPSTCSSKSDTTFTFVKAAGGDRQVRVGDPINLEWQAVYRTAAQCKAPVYLIVDTEQEFRASGNGFIAFPPGVPGPFGIAHEVTKFRIFVPLHAGVGQKVGQLSLHFFREGTASANWTVVEVPRLFDDSEFAEDYDGKAPIELARGALPLEFDIASGEPEILVRDRFSTELPVKMVAAPDGVRQMQIFKEFYRVVDGASGDLVFERSGMAPNFSPSGRFIAAFAEGGGLEIVDLVAEKVIFQSAEYNRDHNFNGSGSLLAWSHGDAYAAVGFWGWGGIQVINTLIDRQGPSFPDTSCHACQGAETKLLLNLEAGMAMYSKFGRGFAGLAGIEYAPHREFLPAENLFSTTAEEDAPRPDWNMSGAVSVSNAIVYWDADGTSYYCRLGALLKCEEDRETKPEVVRGAMDIVRSWKTPFLQSSDASVVPHSGAVKLGPDRAIAARSENPNGSEVGRTIWDLFQRYGAKFDPANGMAFRKVTATSEDDPVKRAALVSANDPFLCASQLLGTKTDADEASADSDYEGYTRPSSKLDPALVEEVWHGRTDQERLSVVHSYYSFGASSRFFFHLISEKSDQSCSLIDFEHLLKNRLGERDGELAEYTDERAMNFGFGAWPASVQSVTLWDDRYLVIHAAWTRASLGSVLVFDLHSEEIIYFNRDIASAGDTIEFVLSRNHKLLAQRSRMGSLYIHGLENKKVVFNGYFVDEELLVYNENGYFIGTPEAANFLYLRFPGSPGYQAVRQFAKILRKPELLSAYDASVSLGKPLIQSPPVIQLKVTSSGEGAAQISISVRSENGLEKIKVYGDGREIWTRAVQGKNRTVEDTVTLAPETRWLTAVAVDKNGLESRPQVRALSAPKTPIEPAGSLYIVAVGTDQYDSEYIDQLQLAKADANNFVATAKLAGRSYYRNVSSIELLDRRDLKVALPAVLRETAAKATKNDTIMLLIAGHGLRMGEDRFFLATRSTEVDRIAETSIAWSEVAQALSAAKGRVIAFVDACHSGSAGNNDDAVDGLFAGDASIAVIAASKGWQESFESDAGGEFTSSVAELIGSKHGETDADGNGTVELAELYRALKIRVLDRTKGQQAPWIARNRMPGELPLF